MVEVVGRGYAQDWLRPADASLPRLWRLEFGHCQILKEEEMTDRRPINPNVNVPKPGGGEQPRARNKDGQIREKRDDAGKPRKK